EYAVQVLVTGLSMFATIAIFRAFRDACPEASPRRLFIGSVMFPSIAFWTAALHKESFCIIGMGGLFSAWRAVYSGRWLWAILYAAVGGTLILIFRAPVIAPLLLGLASFVALERLQKFRGLDAVILGPFYIAVGLGVLTVGMILMTRTMPAL